MLNRGQILSMWLESNSITALSERVGFDGDSRQSRYDVEFKQVVIPFKETQ